MVLLDWTRMGHSFCLAGAVYQEKQWRIVRPLLRKLRDAPRHNAGWPAYLMEGHTRWEIFELIGPQLANSESPHLEDLWVRAMRSRRRLASPEVRRAILAATMRSPQEPLFGSNLDSTRTAAYLQPGTGKRSLATHVLSPHQLRFDAVWREGRFEPDIRVELPLPDLGYRGLAVKDHHLLLRTECTGSDIEQRLKTLHTAMHQMGEQIVVRLGLSRAYAGGTDLRPVCWLMADGFFSLVDPQP
jgi:hypothetical protein